MKPFNGLKPSEAERLALVAEEAAEIVQAVTKILRHGYESRWPKDGLSNRAKLEVEIGDLLAAVSLLQVNEDVGIESIQAATLAKCDNVLKWLHHNKRVRK